MQPRRAASLSSPFLWLMGVTLFLPLVKACERVESPAQLVSDGAPLFLALLSPFLVAGLLAIVILVALLKRVEPSRRTWLAALSTVLPVLGSPSVLSFVFLDKPRGFVDYAYAAGSAEAILLALFVLVVGARRRGWARLMSTVAAFTILSLPMTIFFVHGLIEDGVGHIYVGGVTFTVAMLGLSLLTVFSSRAITRA